MQREEICSQGSSLKKGVLFLTVSNLLVKVLGFAYKVPLNALLGDEMASVNAASALFAVLYTAMAAGIPGALSLSVSRARAMGDGARIKRLFDTTLFLLLGLGLLLSLSVFWIAKPMASRGEEGALCTLAIAPALFFTAATSVLRGYFQGFSRLVPTAISELFEAIGKAGFGVLLAFLALRVFDKTARSAAALAVFGITLGIMLGTLFLTMRYLKEGRALLATMPSEKGGISRREALRTVLLLALPITLSSALMSTSGLIDARMMRPLLEEYFGDARLAKALYSDYSTGALTLYNLPIVLVVPIGVALIPYISGAVASGARERAKTVTARALKLTLLVALPSAFGLSALASPVLSFVFCGDTNMTQHAAPSLSVLAFGVIFTALLTVTSSALQAFKRERLPIFSLGIGALLKLCTISPLVGRFGTLGVPLSTLCFLAVSATVNLVFLYRTAHLQLSLFDTFLRPFLCALAIGTLAYMTHRGLSLYLGADLSLLLAILLPSLIYFALLFLFGAVTREELALLPFFRKRAGKQANL